MNFFLSLKDFSIPSISIFTLLLRDCKVNVFFIRKNIFFAFFNVFINALLYSVLQIHDSTQGVLKALSLSLSISYLKNTIL